MQNLYRYCTWLKYYFYFNWIFVETQFKEKEALKLSVYIRLDKVGTNHKPSLIQIIWWLSDTSFFLKLVTFSQTEVIFLCYNWFLNFINWKFKSLIYRYNAKKRFVFVRKWFQSDLTKTTTENSWLKLIIYQRYSYILAPSVTWDHTL